MLNQCTDLQNNEKKRNEQQQQYPQRNVLTTMSSSTNCTGRYSRRDNNPSSFQERSRRKQQHRVALLSSLLFVILLSTVFPNVVQSVPTNPIRSRRTEYDEEEQKDKKQDEWNGNNNNHKNNMKQPPPPPLKNRPDQRQQPKKPNKSNNPFRRSFDGSSSSSSSSSSSFHNRLNGTEFIKSIFHDTNSKKPRHVIQGLVYGIKSVITGTMMAIMSIGTIPLWHYRTKGPNGLLVGTLSGLAYAVIFTIVGYGQAVQKLYQGCVATPAAIIAARLGQIWNETKEAYVYYYLDQEALELHTKSKYYYQRDNDNHTTNSAARPVFDTLYYDILQIPTNASPKEIKRAYYRQARDVHPDKNLGGSSNGGGTTTTSSSNNGPSLSPDEAAELFRQVHVAYVTLSDEEKRYKYDKYGPLTAPGSGGGDNTDGSSLLNEFDPYVFYAVLFNSQLVDPYIGQLTIASFTDEIVHLVSSSAAASDNKNQSPQEVWKLLFNSGTKHPNDLMKLQKRHVDIAMFLRSQVEPYVNGTLTVDEYRAKCREEAHRIGVGSIFGYEFLYTIGTALQLEAKQYVGFQQFYSIPDFLLGNLSFLQKRTNRIRRLVGAMQKTFHFIRTLVELTYEHQQELLGTDPNKRRQQDAFVLDEKVLQDGIHRLLPTLMDMAWTYNAQDISTALHGACRKLFLDAGTNTKYKKLERAEGVRILGEEFTNEATAIYHRLNPKMIVEDQQEKKSNDNYFESIIGINPSNVVSTKKITTTATADDYLVRLEVAFQISQMKSTRQDERPDSEKLIKQKQATMNKQKKRSRKR